LKEQTSKTFKIWSGQQMSVFTLRVYPWFWIPARVLLSQLKQRFTLRV